MRELRAEVPSAVRLGGHAAVCDVVWMSLWVCVRSSAVAALADACPGGCFGSRVVPIGPAREWSAGSRPLRPQAELRSVVCLGHRAAVGAGVLVARRPRVIGAGVRCGALCGSDRLPRYHHVVQGPPGGCKILPTHSVQASPAGCDLDISPLPTRSARDCGWVHLLEDPLTYTKQK